MILKFTQFYWFKILNVIRVAIELICFDVKIWNKSISVGLASIMSTR